MARDYDMIVIGGGSAGLTAAGMSALLGAKTLLIERSRLGGECTWSGCIPSKTLLRVARAAHEMRSAARFGLHPVEPRVDFARVMEHVRHTRESIYEEADAPPQMEKLGVEVLAGEARFIDAHTIELRSDAGERKLTSRYFVIATGSSPKNPQFSIPCLTNESIFELTSQPGRLLIVGAGPVGIEMAQAFCRLGSAITVVAPGARVLPRDDPDHSPRIQEVLATEGVSFRLGRKVTGLERAGESLRATLDDGSTLDCDQVLAAMGREPVTDSLDLARAGVKTGGQGIEINSHCRTSQKNIWAVGDVTGRFQFTHMAEHMSKVAVTNAILRWPQELDEKHVVWSTFTEPEIAHLGSSEENLRRAGIKYSVFRFPFHKLDRAIADGAGVGEVKVLTDGGGRILGASIIGAHAGEMIVEYALAMRNGIRLSGISSTIHPYPTYMLGNRKAADRRAEKQLDSPLLALLGRLFGYRGVRNGSRSL